MKRMNVTHCTQSICMSPTADEYNECNTIWTLRLYVCKMNGTLSKNDCMSAKWMEHCLKSLIVCENHDCMSAAADE